MYHPIAVVTHIAQVATVDRALRARWPDARFDWIDKSMILTETLAYADSQGTQFKTTISTMRQVAASLVSRTANSTMGA